MILKFLMVSMVTLLSEVFLPHYSDYSIIQRVALCDLGTGPKDVAPGSIPGSDELDVVMDELGAAAGCHLAQGA